MVDVIVVAVIAVIIGAAVVYIRKEKKKGVKCIGCPAAGTCSAHNHTKGGGCSCDGSNMK